MKVYIATSLGNWLAAKQLAWDLTRLDHQVVSRWHSAPPSVEAGLSHDAACDVAFGNYEDIDAADVVVLIATPACRGALVESGYALGARKPVVAVGEIDKATLMLRPAVWVDRADRVARALELIEQEVARNAGSLT